MIDRNNSALAAFLVACLGIGLFSGMDAIMKHLAIALGAYNALFWRLACGALMGSLLFLGARAPWPGRDAMRLHMVRGCIGPVMAFTFFWGIARVPLAEGIALSFIAPLIALYLAAVLLKETIGREAIIASVMGLGGVLIMLMGRASTVETNADVWWGIGSIFVSAIFYAYNLILQRQQALLAKPVEIVFFQSLFAFLVFSLFAPFWASVPEASHWPAIGAAALVAAVSLFLLAWAYARAEAQILVPVEYSAFLWAMLLGWLYFDEQVTWFTLLGAVLIVAACIVAARKTKPA